MKKPWFRFAILALLCLCLFSACSDSSSPSPKESGTVADEQIDRAVLSQLGAGSDIKEHALLDEMAKDSLQMASIYLDESRTEAEREQAYQEIQRLHRETAKDTFTYYSAMWGAGTTREAAVASLCQKYQSLARSDSEKAVYCGMAEGSVCCNGKTYQVVSVAFAW